jgi:hypothetical protein
MLLGKFAEVDGIKELFVFSRGISHNASVALWSRPQLLFQSHDMYESDEWMDRWIARQMDG